MRALADYAEHYIAFDMSSVCVQRKSFSAKLSWDQESIWKWRIQDTAFLPSIEWLKYLWETWENLIVLDRWNISLDRDIYHKFKAWILWNIRENQERIEIINIETSPAKKRCFRYVHWGLWERYSARCSSWKLIRSWRER